MIRGTRIIEGEEARLMSEIIEIFRQKCINAGFKEIIVPSLWNQETFVLKAGKEVLSQMYAFKDKGDRDICLIPEVTAIVQETYKNEWQHYPKPVKVFYVQRCYRYERPQAGRYREFTQFGIEILGDKDTDGTRQSAIDLLNSMLNIVGIPYSIRAEVKRGLDYYIEDGFEASCELLGAQKQIAGGGRYDCGIGFAIGVDRVVLAKQIKNESYK